MIAVSQLRKHFETVVPLRGLDAVINKGDVVAIIGPSGSGKSTFIRCLNLLEQPTSGSIKIDGEEIANGSVDLVSLRQKIGMVFREFNLFPHLTAVENIVAAPVDLLGMSKKDAYCKAMGLLREVGLEDRALHYPDELSSGQQQRVAIARALAMNPEAVLLDEPTSALDPVAVGEVEIVLRELAKQGMTMIIVTHDMRLARNVANRVFYMDEGVVYEEGTPEEIFENPQRERTVRFIHRLKVLDEVITSRGFDFIEVESHLEEYCRRHAIPAKLANRLRVAFEELCVQVVIPLLPEHFSLRFTLEYAAETNKALVQVRYDGDRLDPRDAGDDLALLLVEGLAENLEYSVIDDGEYTNLIAATFAL